MQLKMNEYQLPERIGFNYEELKAGMIEKVSFYETLVYTDENIGEAKKDRANLNKLKTALNDERIRLEKAYMQPFNEFKAQINEIIGIIDNPISVIDKQVKGFDEQKKAEKLEAIKKYWDEKEKPFPITFEKVMDQKWLNSSVSMKSIKGAIDVLLEQIKKDLATLQNLPEFSFEAIETYKTSLDLSKAISEGQRLAAIQKRKEEAERQKAEQERIAAERAAEQARLKAEAEFAKNMNPPVVETPAPTVVAHDVLEEVKPVEEREWVAFRALITEEDGLALKEFFKSRNIAFEPVRVY